MEERADIAFDGFEQFSKGMIKIMRLRGNNKGEREMKNGLADFRKKRPKHFFKPIKPKQGTPANSRVAENRR
jgi:hypothetical protein